MESKRIDQLPAAPAALTTHLFPAFNGTATQYVTGEQLLTLFVAAIVDSAPGTLDTLNELAAALGDDPNFSATILAALAERVRFDAAQGKTPAEQAVARANIGVVSGLATEAANFTFGAADRGKTKIVTGAAVTAALAASATLGADWIAGIVADGGDVTIDPDGAELIDGQGSIILYKGQSAWIICDGTGFRTMRERAFAPQYMHVRDEKASGTDGGGASATTHHTRTLNVTIANTIAGASRSGSQVTLPAGTYDFYACAPGRMVERQKLRLRNITDGTTIFVGKSSFAHAGGSDVIDVTAFGRFTLAAQKVIELQHYCQAARTIDGLGVATSSGDVEVYAELKLRRVGP